MKSNVQHKLIIKAKSLCLAALSPKSVHGSSLMYCGSITEYRIKVTALLHVMEFLG
jgi:hypothetical protein